MRIIKSIIFAVYAFLMPYAFDGLGREKQTEDQSYYQQRNIKNAELEGWLAILSVVILVIFIIGAGYEFVKWIVR